MGPPGLYTTTRELQTRTFERSGLQKHHQNSTKRPPREGRKKKFRAGERKKSAKFWALHPSGPHPSGPHPSGPHLFWVRAPTAPAPTPSGPHFRASHHFGPPTPSGPHPSGPHHPTRPPPNQKKKAKCGLAKFGQIRLAKCGQLSLAKCGIGQIRFGQIRPNKDGQIRFGQMRPRPKKLVTMCRTRATTIRGADYIHNRRHTIPSVIFSLAYSFHRFFSLSTNFTNACAQLYCMITSLN